MFYEIENEQLYTVEGGNIVEDGATIISAGAAGWEAGGAIGEVFGGPEGKAVGNLVGGAFGIGCGIIIVVTD